MCDLPNDLKPIYESWLCRWHKQDDIQDHNKYKKKDNEWGYSVNTNPFIAIETHINEDTITDLLAHILQTDEEIKMEFINFLLNKANKEKIIKEEVKKTEIETQYYIQNQGKKSRLDLFIKIPNKYYIIIENKIFDAPEQPKQMERYIGGIWRQHDQIIISNLLKPDFQPNRQVIVPIYKFTNLCQKPCFIVRHDKVPRLFTNFGFVLSKYDSKD